MNNESAIEEAIKKSKAYAKKGDKLSKEAIKLVRKASSEILLRLDQTVTNLNDNNVNYGNGLEGLVEQLNQIKNELIVLPDKMLDDIRSISQKTINITLFGRTMAGKSTLMEILTHGTGEAIGKGFQRTTRDVREYSYKGLKITDVPGIAAFEGREDEEIAYTSAKKADLIFFLITDDAPQASEADCLRRILELGKPVICLVNIKANLDGNTSLKMFSRDLNKKMTTERLNAIKKQFLSFGASYGQSWDMLTFEFVHLKAAYLSQSLEWHSDNDELYTLSRFSNIEKLIVDEVTRNSGYYKIKAYIDTVIVPLLTTADILVQQAADNYNQSKIIENKKDKLNKWLTKFRIRGSEQIEKSLNELKNEIKREIPSFSEKYYDDKQAGDRWQEVIESFRIETRCNEILKRLAEECEDKLTEIYREIAAELKFSSVESAESDIHMNSIIDGKRIWNWGVTITSGVLTVLALFGVPVVGWVALGVGVVGGLLSLLFKSKDQKIKEAREKLEKKLQSNIEKIFIELKKNLTSIFQDELITQQVTPSFILFESISETIRNIANVQSEFAKSLYDKQEEINKIMLSEATLYLNETILMDNILHISRLPGTCLSLCVSNLIDRAHIEKLEQLTKETIIIIVYSSELKDLLSKQIGITSSKISIEYTEKKEPLCIHIETGKSISPNLVNRIKLAQQLAKTYISR